MSTNSFSKISISAYPKPGIIFVKLFSLIPNEGLRPVVTEIAKLAASFSLLSIIFEEDWREVTDYVSLNASCSAIPEPGCAVPLCGLAPPAPEDSPFRCFSCEGNFGRNSFSQYAVTKDFLLKYWSSDRYFLKISAAADKSLMAIFSGTRPVKEYTIDPSPISLSYWQLVAYHL